MLQGDGWAFIHIPKCGGMALRRHLTGIEMSGPLPMGGAAPIRSPLHRMPMLRPEGKVFTVIRHPAKWLRSFWLDQSPERIRVKRYLHQFWSDDLDEFVMNVCEKRPGYVTDLYREHLRYRDIKVFRLQDGLDAVLCWLGIPDQRVARVNASPAGPKLGAEAMKMVALTEGRLIRKYGLG